MIPGVKITLNGREFVVPPVNRAELKKYAARFKAAAAGEMSADDQLGFFGDLAFDAIRRNYPDLTETDFDAVLDLVNAPVAFAAVMSDAAGVKRAGEAMAAFQSGISTGILKLPESAATPAGGGTPPSN